VVVVVVVWLVSLWLFAVVVELVLVSSGEERLEKTDKL
jgi:hypothetical protein